MYICIYVYMYIYIYIYRYIHIYIYIISDDISKSVRNDRAKLQKDYLQEVKEKEDEEFAFISWLVPAQILYKVSSTKLSFCRLTSS